MRCIFLTMLSACLIHHASSRLHYVPTRCMTFVIYSLCLSDIRMRAFISAIHRSCMIHVPSKHHTKSFLSNHFSISWSSPRPISTSQLHALLHFHPKPINLVVFKGSYSYDGISYLEGGFTLRCLQRLSLPDLATRP